MQERLTRERLEAYSKFEWIHPDSLVPAQMAAELLEARELIESLVSRHFIGCVKWSSAFSLIIGKGMRYLASIGRLEIESDNGVRVVGRLKP